MKMYHQTTKSKILYCLAEILMAMVFFTLMAYMFPARWLQIFFGAFLLLGTLLSLPIAFIGLKITISPEGIEYGYFHSKTSVAWSGFDRVGTFMFREGLFIKNNHALTVKNLPFPAWETRSNIANCFFIPLSPFDRNWHGSLIGQQIKLYAPHLFEKEKSVQSA